MTDSVGAVLLRTTACTVLASMIAGFLLSRQQVRSPFSHRFAAVLVLVQGWAVVPFVFEVPLSETPNEIRSQGVVYSLAINDGTSSGMAIGREVETSTSTYPIGTWICCFWLVGAVVAIGWWVRQYLSFVCKLPLGSPTTNEAWLAEWTSLRTQLQLEDSTQFRVANAIGPLVCFVPFFYLVLVPSHLWSVLNCRQRRAILLHELAHIKRRDLWKSVAVRCLALPQWFNPIAWRAVREFDEAAEWACDDLVVNDRGQNFFESYMSALLRVAESHVHSVPATVAFRGGILSRRIRRLAHSPIKEDFRMTKLLVPTLLIVLTLTQTVRIQTVLADDVRKASDEFRSSREADLARTGLQPYRIESPDLISIKTTPDDEGTNSELTIDGQFLVQPDGNIELDGLGSIKIQDMTTDKIEKAIRAHFGDKLGSQRLVVRVEKQNSKSIYLVVDTNKEFIVRMPCTADTDLLRVLNKATLPHPIDFAQANIQVKRASGNRVNTLSVVWDEIKGKPKSDQNHKLLPGDRIIVTPRNKGTVVEATPSRPRAVPASPLKKRIVVDSDQPLVKIEMLIFEDTKGTLDEFESLSKSSVMFGDANQTKATLNIFARNNLINTLARPQVMCVSGQATTIEVNPNGLSVRITPTVQANSNVVLDTKVNIRRKNDGINGELDIQTAAIVEKGKTIVMKARPHPHEQLVDEDESAVYVAFTTEVVNR